MTDPTIPAPADAAPGTTQVQMPVWMAEFFRVSQEALEIAGAHQDAQPGRIAAARERVQVERERSALEQPWDAILEVSPLIEDGEWKASMAHASHEAAAMWGVRLALEVANAHAADDPARAFDAVFMGIASERHALLVAGTALLHLAITVIPALLDAAEGGPDFAVRPALAEALANAWADRVSQQEG